MLKKHVSSEGKVNYSEWKKSESELDQYLIVLQNNPPQPSWSSEKELAYWINAYNAATVKMVLENWPVRSIKEICNGDPWNKNWIQLQDKNLSLNDIEHKIIRKKFYEPRIHFAVNCAAKSCPPLANKAYTEKNIEVLLDFQTRNFINNPDHNRITTSKIEVSKIFEWYSNDFGSVKDFISDYSKKSISPSAQLSYLEYDWSLNGY